MKNMLTGAILERTFKSGEKLKPADVESREMQFLYKEGDMFVFMDTVNYEQVQLVPELIGDAAFYMIDGLMADVLFIGGRPPGGPPPPVVGLRVGGTQPRLQGGTSNHNTKPAQKEGRRET